MRRTSGTRTSNLSARMKTKTNEVKLSERILGNKTEVIKIGLDVQARDVVMCVQEDASLAPRPQRTNGA